MKKEQIASSLDTFRVVCPKCGAKPYQDCWNGAHTRRTRHSMHKERHQEAARRKQAAARAAEEAAELRSPQ